MKKYWFLLSVVFFSISGICQIAVGQWRDHLPYMDAKFVADAGAKVYCATGAAVFSLNKSDNSLEKISKVTGLSDVGISALAYNMSKKTLVVGYTNGNIDLIQNNTIYNLADIKRKTISSSKVIADVFFDGNFAYLSCGFGIVVLDVDRLEISDTWYIGESGSYVEVLEVDILDNYIYAATEVGILRADLNSSNLANFANWDFVGGIPSGTRYISHLVSHQGRIYYSCKGGAVSDTIYAFNDSGYEYIDTIECYSLNSSNGRLLYPSWMYVNVYDNGEKYAHYYENARPKMAVFDSDSLLWVADNRAGLIRFINNTYNKFYPNGPFSADVVDMSASQGNLLAAAGGRNNAWGNIWNSGEVNFFRDETWRTFLPSAGDTLHDIVSVIVNPNDPNQAFAGSWNGGLLEYEGNVLKATYKYGFGGSTLQPVNPGTLTYKISGMDFDNDGNLWITNPDTDFPVSVKLADGSWYGFPYANYFNNFLIDEIVATNNGPKWLSLPKGQGLFAFDEKQTYADFDDDEYRAFSILDEHGEIITNDIYSIAEDKEGYIWIGTNAGVVVYYNPENVFSGSDFYAQRVIIEIDGVAQYLLETETVTDIVVDGANRKWFATQNAGVFLMSDDGSEQILNFNTDNSPLLSNNVFCLAIDGDSGEVYFGTDKGIISYKGTATEGKDEFKEVYVYPNPVRPEYDGPITITNLVANASVKITDITGNLAYETKAEGGQAIWDGRNFDGKRVQTGVYLVFCTNEDGSKTHVAKLLFIN